MVADKKKIMNHLTGNTTSLLLTTDYFINKVSEDLFLLKTTFPLRELSEKIPTGDSFSDTFILLENTNYSPSFFEKLSSLKDLQIPQELFPDFSLSTAECMHQVLTTSLGVVKKAKVVTFFGGEDGITRLIVNDGGYPGRLICVTIYAAEKKYGLIGNILKRKAEQ